MASKNIHINNIFLIIKLSSIAFIRSTLIFHFLRSVDFSMNLLNITRCISRHDAVNIGMSPARCGGEECLPAPRSRDLRLSSPHPRSLQWGIFFPHPCSSHPCGSPRGSPDLLWDWRRSRGWESFLSITGNASRQLRAKRLRSCGVHWRRCGYGVKEKKKGKHDLHLWRRRRRNAIYSYKEEEVEMQSTTTEKKQKRDLQLWRRSRNRLCCRAERRWCCWVGRATANGIAARLKEKKKKKRGSGGTNEQYKIGNESMRNWVKWVRDKLGLIIFLIIKLNKYRWNYIKV